VKNKNKGNQQLQQAGFDLEKREYAQENKDVGKIRLWV